MSEKNSLSIKNKKAKKELKNIASNIGPGIFNISFCINLRDFNISLTPDNFNLCVKKDKDSTICFTGNWRDIKIKWKFFKKRRRIFG